MSEGRHIRLFLVNGTPGGLLTAEIINWTGHVLAAPRSELATLLRRPEVNRTGIYILIGDDPESLGGQLAYIGEGDDVSRRLYQHSRPEDQNGKDFWNRAIVLTNKDNNLTKAHARYLESRFIALAQEAGRARLINGTAPPLSVLPEADTSDMEYFIAQAKIILPVLGINLLRSAGPVTTPSPVPNGDAGTVQLSPMFVLRSKKYGIEARAQEIDGEFTVLAGSHARKAWSGGEGGYRSLFEQLEHEGVLDPAPDGSSQVFTKNCVFSSPSAAAAVVTGRSANGRNEWKDAETGQTFGSWQNRDVDRAAKEVLT